jgi:hypothetical protein
MSPHAHTPGTTRSNEIVGLETALDVVEICGSTGSLKYSAVYETTGVLAAIC